MLLRPRAAAPGGRAGRRGGALNDSAAGPGGVHSADTGRLNDESFNPRLVQHPGGKQCVGRDEAELVSKRVFAVEASLAPGLSFDGAHNDRSRVARASEGTFQIGHGEIHVVRIWGRVPGIAIRTRIKAREYDVAAPEVVTSGRNSRPARSKQRPIELRSPPDVADRKDHSKQSNHGTTPGFHLPATPRSTNGR
jgi:hypothetical protein